MAEDFVHNNPRDLAKERYDRLEAQVTDTNHNMNLLTTTLESKLKPFEDDRGFNSEINSEGKSGD
jgi:hypothetical protein